LFGFGRFDYRPRSARRLIGSLPASGARGSAPAGYIKPALR
jgi:hypothetical protein